MEDLDLLYNNVARLIYELMPARSEKYVFQCDFSNGNKYRMYWFDEAGNECNYSLDEFPDKGASELLYLYRHIYSEMAKLNSNWTHSSFIVMRNGNYDIQFAYVAQEDSWPMLYMKGISDLTWEEAQEYYIPREIWEERVRLKNSQS